MNEYQQFFKARRDVAKKKSPKSPSKIRKKSLRVAALAIFASFAAGVSVWFVNTDDAHVTQIVRHIEVSLFGPAEAQEGAKSAADKPKSEDKTSPSAATDGQPEAVNAKGAKRTWTDEEVALFQKLDERKQQLDAREASLNKLEEELQKQREDLEKRLAALEEVRGKIAAKLDDKVKADGEKVSALVSVYSNMKPAQAAKIIEGLNEDLAVEVLTKMKNKNAAEILNQMDPEKAKHLSEKFAGFKEAANSVGN